MQTENRQEPVMLAANENGFVTRVHFPEVIGDKIATGEFLSAASEVVRIVEKLGKIFAPVKYDMQGNINKLNSRFAMNKEKNATLQEMILLEVASVTPGSIHIATDALMWLTRALHMILVFFELIVMDNKLGSPTEDLVATLRIAYEKALEPYHGWMAQQLFGLLSRAVPARAQLLKSLADGQNVDNDALLKEMESYLINLRKNVQTIQEFYRSNNLEQMVVA